MSLGSACPWEPVDDTASTQCLSTSLARCSLCFYLRLPAQAGPNTSMNFTMKMKGFWSFLIPLVPPCSQGRNSPDGSGGL